MIPSDFIKYSNFMYKQKQTVERMKKKGQDLTKNGLDIRIILPNEMRKSSTCLGF